MYSCQETTALASDYLERKLSRWERLQFRLHLWMCDRCTRFLRQLRVTIGLLRGRRAVLTAPPSGPECTEQRPLDAEQRALVERFRAAHPPKA